LIKSKSLYENLGYIAQVSKILCLISCSYLSAILTDFWCSAYLSL